jgi:PAS domain S-box-containing protein
VVRELDGMDIRQYLEVAGIIIIALDKDGKVLFINRKTRELLGYSEEQIVGKDWFENFVPDEIRENVKSVFRKVISGESVPATYCESPIITAKGEERVIAWDYAVLRDENGGIACVFASGTDITEFKRAVEEKLEAYRLAFNVVESMADPVAITDLEGRILFVNRAFEEITGFKREDAIGKKPSELGIMDPELDRKIMSEIVPLLFEKGCLRNIEIRGKRVDGTELQGLATFSLIRDSEGKPVGTVRVVRDISEVRKLEEARRRAERALRVLSMVNEEIIKATNEQELLERVCRIIVDVGGYSYAWVGFAEEDKTVRPVAMAGIDGYAHEIKVTWDESETGLGPTGTAIRERKPKVVRDISTDPGFTLWREKALKWGFASSIALPLICGDTVFGALNIYASEKDAFDEEEVDLLKKLSDNLAFGIKMLRERSERRKIEELYRTVVENTGTAITIVDEDTNVVFANREVERILGVEREEVVGKKWLDFITKDEVERILRYHRLRRIDESLVPRSYETKAVDPEGNVKNLLVTVAMIPGTNKSIASFVDITNLREMERELRESEERYRTLFEKSPLGIVLVGVDMTIIDCNDAALEMFGLSREDVVGKKWIEFGIFEEKDLPRVLELFYKGIQRKRTVVDLKVKIGGQERWIEVTSVLLEKGGKPYAFLNMIKDITESVQSRRKLERMLKQLDLLHRVDLGIIREGSLESALSDALKGLQDVVQYDLVGVAIYSDSEVRLVFHPEEAQEMLSSISERKIIKEVLNKRGRKGVRVTDLLKLEDYTRLEVDFLNAGMKSYIAIPLIARGEEVGILIIASRSEIPDGDYEFLKNFATQLAIALHEAVLFEQRRIAFERIEDNIEKFAILVDHIRNPLAVISGIAGTKIEDEKTKKILLDQVERILETVRQLDEGWLESEVIKEFLKRSQRVRE